MATLARLDTFIVDYPVKGQFRFLPAAQGRTRRTIMVRLIDSDGRVGWGQSVPSSRWSYETAETVQSTIENYFAPALVGFSLDDWPAIQKQLDALIGPAFSRGQPLAKAAVDLAWVDWNLRRQNATVASWVGGKGRSWVSLSWTLDAHSMEELLTQIQEGLARGYRAFNMKLTGRPDDDVQLCKAARRHAADAFFWVDANGNYELADALNAAPHFADLGVAAWEQPFPSNRISWYQRLKRIRALPILLDEPIITQVDLEEFYHLSMLDGIAIKVSRCGGLHEARRILEWALDRNLYILASGLTDPDISLAATLLLLSAYDYEKPAALNGPQFLEGSVLEFPIQVERGTAVVPRGPGLAVEVNEAAVKTGHAVVG
jgi:L-alanine-DL-glutamate epimerase-like enolase superfamily enzyme